MKSVATKVIPSNQLHFFRDVLPNLCPMKCISEINLELTLQAWLQFWGGEGRMYERFMITVGGVLQRVAWEV